MSVASGTCALAQDEIAELLSQLRLQLERKKSQDSNQDEEEEEQRYEGSNFCLKSLEFLKTIGTGTFGRVLLTRHSRTRQYFALKVLNIHQLVLQRQVQHIRSEKSILQSVKHPFIVRLYWTNHDSKLLYMLFEFVSGGELFSYLRNFGRLSEASAKFYTAETLCAIDYLHRNRIVYRDLKPENLLLDSEGHLKVTDFGFAKVVNDRTFTICGTPEYLAPEVLEGRGYNESVDYWCLGVLLHEMLFGSPPFCDDENVCSISNIGSSRTCELYTKILTSPIRLPATTNVGAATRDLLRRLLTRCVADRIGCGHEGFAEVKAHPWFESIGWQLLELRQVQPPILPQIAHPGDTACFDEYDETDLNSLPNAASYEVASFSDF